MDNDVSKLENQLIDNKQKIALLAKENEHISFCLDLLKKQPTNIKQQTFFNETKKSLRSQLFDLINVGETITINEAWQRTSKDGIPSNKASINTALHQLAGEGLLQKPSKGLYKKPT